MAQGDTTQRSFEIGTKPRFGLVSRLSGNARATFHRSSGLFHPGPQIPASSRSSRSEDVESHRQLKAPGAGNAGQRHTASPESMRARVPAMNPVMEKTEDVRKRSSSGARNETLRLTFGAGDSSQVATDDSRVMQCVYLPVHNVHDLYMHILSQLAARPDCMTRWIQSAEDYPHSIEWLQSFTLHKVS